MGGRGYGGGGRGRVFTYRYTVTTRMTCIEMGSDESRFYVSLIVKDKVTRQCPQTKTLYGGGGRGRLYTYRYTVTTRMTCIRMGSDESHFNVSLTVRDKVTRQCPQTTTTEEKGEPKRNRPEVLLLTSLTPLPLGQTGSLRS